MVAARIESINIDQVHVGQEASLRFVAFEQRTTPEIFGQVSRISADVFKDEVTGQSFYRAELLPNEEELDKLRQVAEAHCPVLDILQNPVPVSADLIVNAPQAEVVV